MAMPQKLIDKMKDEYSLEINDDDLNTIFNGELTDLQRLLLTMYYEDNMDEGAIAQAADLEMQQVLQTINDGLDTLVSMATSVILIRFNAEHGNLSD